MTCPAIVSSGSEAVASGVNPVRGRANSMFFVVMDRYINWISGRAKREAFDGIESFVICEIGPGVGANFAWLPRGARLHAIEPNVAMHGPLRRRAAASGVDLDLHMSGAERVPLSDESVDEVVCSLVLCTVADPAAVLAEVRRILRPGGRFRFVEHVEGEPGSLRRGVQRRLRRPWSYCFEGCRLDRDAIATIDAAGFSRLDHNVGLLRGSVFFPVNRVAWGVATR